MVQTINNTIHLVLKWSQLVEIPYKTMVSKGVFSIAGTGLIGLSVIIVLTTSRQADNGHRSRSQRSEARRAEASDQLQLCGAANKDLTAAGWNPPVISWFINHYSSQ